MTSSFGVALGVNLIVSDRVRNYLPKGKDKPLDDKYGAQRLIVPLGSTGNCKRHLVTRDRYPRGTGFNMKLRSRDFRHEWDPILPLQCCHISWFCTP